MPRLFLPIGFAGGVTDPETGLVRFGYRDYDPTVGRFTAPDPARDLRFDGDLYDYCADDPVSRVDPTGLWSKENFRESAVNRDELGRFSAGGDGGAAGGQTGQNPNAKSILKADTPGKGDGTTIQGLPKAPPPIPEGQPLTRFQELAIKSGHADRETLPQFAEVTSGAALNAGHNKGYEERNLKANSEVLVYVQNMGVLPVNLEVKAGSSFNKNELQVTRLGIGSDAVLRFKNSESLTRFISIDSNTASLPFIPLSGSIPGGDSFFVKYQIYSRGHYAKP